LAVRLALLVEPVLLVRLALLVQLVLLVPLVLVAPLVLQPGQLLMPAHLLQLTVVMHWSPQLGLLLALTVWAHSLGQICQGQALASLVHCLGLQLLHLHLHLVLLLLLLLPLLHPLSGLVMVMVMAGLSVHHRCQGWQRLQGEGVAQLAPQIATSCSTANDSTRKDTIQLGILHNGGFNQVVAVTTSCRTTQHQMNHQL
jgi:hypothetical protein